MYGNINNMSFRKPRTANKSPTLNRSCFHCHSNGAIKAFCNHVDCWVKPQGDLRYLRQHKRLRWERFDASNPDFLRSAGITHILNVTREVPNYFPSEFIYSRVSVADSLLVKISRTSPTRPISFGKAWPTARFWSTAPAGFPDRSLWPSPFACGLKESTQTQRSSGSRSASRLPGLISALCRTSRPTTSSRRQPKTENPNANIRFRKSTERKTSVSRAKEKSVETKIWLRETLKLTGVNSEIRNKVREKTWNKALTNGVRSTNNLSFASMLKTD